MNIRETVKAIIVDKLNVDESEVVLEASFSSDLGADSLDTVDLIMEVEKVFNIEIPDPDREKLDEVEKVYLYLEKRLEGRE